MSVFEYGDKVTVCEKYVRRIERRPVASGRSRMEPWKVWKMRPFQRDNCIFLGERVLRDGVQDYDSEIGYTFILKEHFKAALVSPGPKENPIYVPFEAIKKVFK